MNWLRFSLAVILTSAALVVALLATGAYMVGNVLANGVHAAQDHGMGFGPGAGLPPELANLKDVPAGERFAHFKGVQANLTDKDGKPITVLVTPGVASSVSTNNLTIVGNDGASHSFTLNDQTITRGKAVTSGEDVVVVTFDNTNAARAVFGANPGDWGHR